MTRGGRKVSAEFQRSCRLRLFVADPLNTQIDPGLEFEGDRDRVYCAATEFVPGLLLLRELDFPMSSPSWPWTLRSAGPDLSKALQRLFE